MQEIKQNDVCLLIVDDSINNTEVISSALEQKGLKIFTTTSPTVVLDLCVQENISIALIDVKMPILDGFQILNLIKTDPRTVHILVVLITGYLLRPEDVVRGLNGGAVDYLFKPLDLYITLAKIKSLMTLVKHENEIKNQNIQLKKYQEELFEALAEKEKSKVFKENFLANMSHEIRTPLNGVVGLTSLLKKASSKSEQVEIINLLEYSSKSLLGIVNDILESAQLDAGKITLKREKTDIRSLVQNVCDSTSPIAKDKGLLLTCKVHPDVPTYILADSLRLNQILINLVNNAIKFTNVGSVSLNVKSSNSTQDHIVLQFIVNDTGIGIPKSEISKVFNRFEQVENRSRQQFGGTGLGLSIVKRLVELKGGTINVESELGVGTTFIFTNKFRIITENKNSQVNQDQLSILPSFKNISLLLADDNLTNQYVVLKLLKEWNIKVETALNGWEAYEKLRSKYYDLILMDTHMPVMDGIVATKKIRSELNDSKKNTPIISFSASVMEHEKDIARLAGSDDFLEKPFDPVKLHAKIYQFTSCSR